MAHPLSVLDLFAGAGGLAEGFRSAGYEIVAAVEANPQAAATLELNHSGTAVLAEDLRRVDSDALLNLCGGSIDVVVGGPPCQGFSIQHGSRDPRHPSQELLHEFVRVVADLAPVAFVIENVPGLLSFRRGFVIDQLVRSLNRLEVLGQRYRVSLEVLDAVGYGVPQQRRRIFICGILGQDYSWPFPSSERITLNQAIGDLPEWTGAADEALTLPKSYPLTPYQAARRRRATLLYNHSAKRLQELRQERIALLEEGDDRRSLPEHLQSGGRAGKYRRLRGSVPSPTIVAHMAHDTSAFVHPRYNRMLTVREAARLQSFDDTYRFVGSQYQQFKQVGNAVPPLLARALAEALALSARRALRHAQVAAREARRAASA
jgi:DNA (cytosine-5)-methyltransferase 1